MDQDSWSTPRVFRHWPGLRGTAGQHRGPPVPTAMRLGDLVETVNPWTRARVAQDAWSTPRGLGYTHKLPGTAGPLRGPSRTGPISPGRLLDTAVAVNRARVAQDNWWSRGPRTLTGVTWDSWSTPWVLRPGSDSRKTAGTVPNCLGQPVHPVGLRAWDPVAQDASGPLDSSASGP